MANTLWLPSIPPHLLCNLLSPLLPLQSMSCLVYPPQILVFFVEPSLQSHSWRAQPSLISSLTSPIPTPLFFSKPTPKVSLIRRCHLKSLSSTASVWRWTVMGKNDRGIKETGVRCLVTRIVCVSNCFKLTHVRILLGQSREWTWGKWENGRHSQPNSTFRPPATQFRPGGFSSDPHLFSG